MLDDPKAIVANMKQQSLPYSCFSLRYNLSCAETWKKDSVFFDVCDRYKRTVLISRASTPALIILSHTICRYTINTHHAISKPWPQFLPAVPKASYPTADTFPLSPPSPLSTWNKYDIQLPCPHLSPWGRCSIQVSHLSKVDRWACSWRLGERLFHREWHGNHSWNLIRKRSTMVDSSPCAFWTRQSWDMVRGRREPARA